MDITALNLRAMYSGVNLSIVLGTRMWEIIMYSDGNH